MRRSVVLLVLLAATSPSAAAPPTLTQLFPAGGQRGQTVVVTALGAFAPWPVQAWCDSKSIKVIAAKESGKLSIAIAADVIPGTYWIRLYNKEGASELRPFMVGNLSELNEQEPNDDYRKPQALPSAQVVVNGRLGKAGDVDGYAVKLQKGQTLVASLEAHRTLRSPMDGVLQIVSADGFVVAQNDDFHDIDPHIAFAVPKDGTFIARVFAFPSTPDSSIGFAGSDKMLYRLTLTTAGFADHAWPLAVERAKPAAVDIQGWNIADAARKLNPQLLDEAHATVFQSSLANAALVRLEPHATVINVGPADHVRPHAITLPTTISGKLERPGQSDHYQFVGKKGQRLSFQIEARGLLFPLDPVLRLSDAAGKQLAEAHAPKLNADPILDYNVAQDGIYRLEVRDLHGNGGPRFVYRLRALFPQPDFALSVAADRFAMAPGKPLSIPITIERRNGFNKELTFTVEDLPAHVTAMMEPAKLAANAKAATIKLVAAQGTAHSGPIRIVGRAADGAMHRAFAKGTEPEWTTEHLWLTVTP